MTGPINHRGLLALALLVLLVGSGCDKGVELDNSGELITEDLTVGTGEEAVATQRVAIDAKGSLTDGTVFFDSYQQDNPFVFELGRGNVIQGLDEGITGMREGGKRRITIPPRMGFGANEQELIPANSTLVFEVELLDVDHPDSLGIETIREGTGAVARDTSTVEVHYIGSLASGSVFDSSVSRSEPLTFTLGQRQVITGWERGVVGMKEGEVRRLIIPPAMAYGRYGRGPIPPFATLVFTIELLDVVD